VARKGFHAVSISEIGAAAGITGSGVYRHFDSKSAVLVALFDRAIDDLLREDAAATAAHRGRTSHPRHRGLDGANSAMVELLVGSAEDPFASRRSGCRAVKNYRIGSHSILNLKK
jgi:AcrR family transcriptional regulator